MPEQSVDMVRRHCGHRHEPQITHLPADFPLGERNTSPTSASYNLLQSPPPPSQGDPRWTETSPAHLRGWCSSGQAFVHPYKGLSLLGRNFQPLQNVTIRGKTEGILNQNPQWKWNTWFHVAFSCYPPYIRLCLCLCRVSACALPRGGGEAGGGAEELGVPVGFQCFRKWYRVRRQQRLPLRV